MAHCQVKEDEFDKIIKDDLVIDSNDEGFEIADDSISVGNGKLRKSFNLFQLVGVAFGLTNSWLGISSTISLSISSGGAMIVTYGILIIAFISYFVGITLSEMSSAIPSAGGQYVWTRVLAPRKYSSFLAYMCGSFGWMGSIFTSASMALAVASQVLGLWNMTHPEHVSKTWELFVIYELVNIVLALFNCHGKVLPMLGNSALYVSLFSYVVITITVLVCSRGHYQPAHFVFKDFNNNTGWSNSGIAFIVGLINPNWAFSCLDCATHLSEETNRPRRDIPIAILGTVTMGFITSFTYSIAMFFCVRNFDDILSSTSGMPIFDIFYQALQNKAGAVCLGVLILLTASGCTIASHTWQARLCWSFARDNGLPWSSHLQQIHMGVPLKAHIFSTFIVGLLGLLYLASSTAFNSMVIGTITFLLLSYAVPILCLLYRGRENIRHGPFWLGKWGLISNYVTLAWTVFGMVFYSLPSFMPVTAGSMNYISVVYAIYFILALGYWYFPIKKYSCRESFAGGRDSNEELEFPDVCLEDI